MIKWAPTISLLSAGMVCSGATAAPAPGTGLRFDGSRVLAVHGAALALDPEHLTVAAWVKMNATDKSQVFLNCGRASTAFTFYLFRGQIRMLIGHTTDAYLHARTNAPTPGTWIHLAGTYDGQTIRIYRNGLPAMETPAPGRMASGNEDVFIGSLNDHERFLDGEMDDIRLWGRTLSADEIAAVATGASGAEIDQSLLARWTTQSQRNGDLVSLEPGTLTATVREKGSLLVNGKAEGFRGIWYSNQPSGDAYVYKYSGGLGTYCAKHIPLAWYAPEVEKTFFVFGGTDETNSTLFHLVSYYDHRSGLVARPTLLLDKQTTDAHDNPVLNVDDQGYLWVFSSSHGTSRPSYVCRSSQPYSIERFELMWTGNFSYPQPFFYPGKGFLFMHTHYQDGRALCYSTSSDGVTWTARQLLAHIEMGHYQVSYRCGNTIGTAFNMHPSPGGLNWRTNLYYMESGDFGETWHTAGGDLIGIPMTQTDNPALVEDYRAQGLNVYMKDLNFDAKGHPIILFITSPGYQSGPENMPRTWTTAHWNGANWDVRGEIVSDNNYDTGCLHIESDTTWRLIGPTETGPQPYNPGGEMAMWLTENAGEDWRRVAQLTRNSPYNHTYARRPVNAHPGFYALWADGHGRQPSESRLYFCTRDGRVFRLPQDMQGQAMVQPEAVQP